MAERRTQIRELDIPSMSSVTPTASPVETYVRPEQVRTEPGALSEFVSALAPAIKADSDERLRKVLEREQKIQDGRFKNQVNELDQYALQVKYNLHNDFKDNSTEYYNLKDDQDGTAADKIIAIRQTYIDENVAALEREGVDELLVQTFKNEMQVYNNTFLADTFLPGREQKHRDDRQNRLTTALGIILETEEDPANALAAVNKYYNRHVDANWGNHAETLDTMWEYAVTIAPYNADNAIVDWFKSPMSSPEGQPPQWFVGKRAEQRAKIEKAIQTQARENKGIITRKAKDAFIRGEVEKLFPGEEWGNSSADKGEIEVLPGIFISPRSEEYGPYVDNKAYTLLEAIEQNPRLDDETKKARADSIWRSRFSFYNNNGFIPPEVTKSIGNGGKVLLRIGDLTDPQNLEKFSEMMKAVMKADAYSGGMEQSGSISSTVFTGDDYLRYKAAAAMLSAGMNIQQVGINVQGPVYEGRTIELTTEEIKSSLDGFPIINSEIAWTKKAAKSYNLYQLAPKVKSLAEALLQTGTVTSEEEAKKVALQEIGNDYQYVRHPDGSVVALPIESNVLNSPANVEQIEQGLEDILKDKQLVSIIHDDLGLEPRLVGKVTLGLSGVEEAPNFTVRIKPGGNPNQFYLEARPLDEGEASSRTMSLGTINIWDFNARRIQGIKDQLVQKYYKAVEDGLITLGRRENRPDLPMDTFYSLATAAPPSAPEAPSDNAEFVDTVSGAIGEAGVPTPPVRPEELGGGAPLTVPERRLSNAQIRQDERIQRSLDLNREALSEEVVTDEGSSSWIRSIGSAIGKAIFGGEAQSAELESTVAQSLDKAATNPLEFILNNRYLGLSEKDPDHQKTIAGFMNRAVKGRVKNPSDMQLDSNAWCAAFAGHVLSSLGIASPQRYDALRARSYLKVGRGISIDKAQPGDLVVMKTRLRNGKTQWHAGFFVEHDGGKTFKLLGGNQKDQVNVQNNTVANIAGIRRINNVQNIKPDALKAIQRDMTFFGKLQNFLAGYRAK